MFAEMRHTRAVLRPASVLRPSDPPFSTFRLSQLRK
jgi:hypothetical protein